MPNQDVCPHCSASNEFSRAAAGTAVDCPDCDRSFMLPAQAEAAGKESTPDAAAGSLSRPGDEPLLLPNPTGAVDAHSRDVSLTTTGLGAAGLTVLFYLAVVYPLADSYFGQLFGARGWVPYVVSYLSLWCGVLLGAKYLRLRRKLKALDFDLLPRRVSDEITPENVPNFIDYLSRLPGRFSDDFLFQRIRRALDHFEARANVGETVEQLRLDGDRDEGIVESSYTMLRVFIWAIPILGFIGTVLGIGASVSGFSGAVASASNLDVMKDSIGMVTAGLGIAFDTTLLALVMSIFIMVPTSSLQKTEEDYLAQVDDYCQRHLVARLFDGKPQGAAPPSNQWLEAAADQFAEKVVEALDRRMARTD